MSEYTFKPLNEVDTVEEPADGTTVMGFQGGVPIQMPMGAVRPGVFVIDPAAEDYSLTDTAYGDKVKEALLSGKIVWCFLYSQYYSMVVNFDPTFTTNGVHKLRVYPAANPSTSSFAGYNHGVYIEFTISG